MIRVKPVVTDEWMGWVLGFEAIFVLGRWTDI